MYYGYTTEDTDWSEETMNNWKFRLINFLFSMLRANPDIEALYPEVDRWLLEVRDDGWPNREIAFDSNGDVLFRTPNERNTGWFTDMGERVINKSDLELVDAAEFERRWAADA